MNKNKKVILDSSALLALLNKEPGADIVANVIPNSVMSSVNVAEVTKFLIDHRKLNKEQVLEIIDSLITEVISFDKNQAMESASLIITTKQLGLSLGDRACIALGIITGYIVYTSDKAWKKLDTTVVVRVNITVIR